MSRANEPRPYHHGDLRRTLIETALQLLEQEQNWDFTLRELARRAGVSHAAPYKHFADRQELLAEVAVLGFQALTRQTQAAAARHPDDPLAQLSAMGQAYVMYAVEHPAHFRLMFGPALSGGHMPPDLREAGAASRQVMEDVVERCRRAGLLAGEDGAAQTLAAWSLVHGLAMLLIDRRLGPQQPEPRAVAEAVCQVFVGRLRRG